MKIAIFYKLFFSLGRSNPAFMVTPLLAVRPLCSVAVHFPELAHLAPGAAIPGPLPLVVHAVFYISKSNGITA